jgi:hypothetical protein
MALGRCLFGARIAGALLSLDPSKYLFAMNCNGLLTRSFILERKAAQWDDV